MNKLIYLLLLFLLPVNSYCYSQENSDVQQKKVPLGDPFILLHENTYYAYGTNDDNGIAVFTSPDLQTWQRADQLALHKDDVWGDRWFWAPEVYFLNGKFYMYYSADEHMCIATSDSPLGPFKQEVKRPMITDEKTIDNHLFIDSDGTPYLYFCRFNDGNNIWMAKMSADLMEIRPQTMVKCIAVSQPWEEVWPRVNEGAWVHKRDGKYYLMYSANSYESPFYGIGYATADSPTGPWSKYEGNPILQKPQTGKLVGTGHHSLFTDKQGRLQIVFHAHNTVRKIHPRCMYISYVNFDKLGNMRIAPNYTTPVLK